MKHARRHTDRMRNLTGVLIVVLSGAVSVAAIAGLVKVVALVLG